MSPTHSVLEEAGCGKAISVTVLSSREAILRLAWEARPLLQHRHAAAAPAFFLASIDPDSWIPRVVVIRQNDAIDGILYFKERIIAGWSTGLFYIDATLDSAVISAADDMVEIFKLAIAHLRSHARIRGLRILIPRDHLIDTALFAASINMDVYHIAIQNHCVLQLATTYQGFLNGLGSNTRRNFRYYRRRFEAAGGQYVEEMNLDEFERAATSLLPKCITESNGKGLDRAVRMLGATNRPILAGLRDAQGNWLAVVGGWWEDNRVIIFCQMNNDKDYPQSSLCTVLRGYLIVSVIARDCAEMLFWAGVGYPLLRYCVYVPTSAVYFDRPTFGWRLSRSAIAASARFLPESLSTLVQWVSPTKL